MTGPADCELLGRWRITDSDLWDEDYLDLVAPAEIRFEPDDYGAFAFGALEAGMTLEYSRANVFFHFEGSDEGDGLRRGRRNPRHGLRRTHGRRRP